MTVLVSPLLPSTDATMEATRAEYDRRVPEIVREKAAAGKHVALADTSTVKVSDLADAVHPNDARYQRVADAFEDALGRRRRQVHGRQRASGAKGTIVQIRGCNGGDALWWTLRSDGTLRALGKCLDASGFGTANGTKLTIWDCDGGANQKWEPCNGGYRNPLSGRCLDNPGFSTRDGTQLDLWDCDGGINQRWTTPPVVA